MTEFRAQNMFLTMKVKWLLTERQLNAEEGNSLYLLCARAQN